MNPTDQQIEALLPGADTAWVRDQIRKGATLQSLRATWITPVMAKAGVRSATVTRHHKLYGMRLVKSRPLFL